jgi:plastocyanin
MKPHGPVQFGNFIAAMIFCAAWLLCGGCTSSQPAAGNGANPTTAPTGSAAVVAMNFHSFEPKSITIRSGQTVEWKNKSLVWHTVTADPKLAKRSEDVALPHGVEPFDSGKVGLGGTYRHAFTAPGTYRAVRDQAVPRPSRIDWPTHSLMSA